MTVRIVDRVYVLVGREIRRDLRVRIEVVSREVPCLHGLIYVQHHIRFEAKQVTVVLHVHSGILEQLVSDIDESSFG